MGVANEAQHRARPNPDDRSHGGVGGFVRSTLQRVTWQADDRVTATSSLPGTAPTMIRRALSALCVAAGLGLALSTSASPNDSERRGCCSHHQGVCGCSSKRAACCDGTLSPSCGCD
jgi:hypothetical protein